MEHIYRNRLLILNWIYKKIWDWPHWCRLRPQVTLLLKHFSMLTRSNSTFEVCMCKNKGSHFILGGLNYYVLTFKLIIWYNTLIVYIHVLTLYLYFNKHLYVVTSEINFCNYIYNYTVDPPLHLSTPPNMSLTSITAKVWCNRIWPQ